MPVVGVASKLRQPAVGSKPIHTALPIPNPGRSSMAHGPRNSDIRGSESSMLSCQLSLKTDIMDRRTTVPAPASTLGRSSREAEESKICKVSELPVNYTFIHVQSVLVTLFESTPICITGGSGVASGWPIVLLVCLIWDYICNALDLVRLQL